MFFSVRTMNDRVMSRSKLLLMAFSRILILLLVLFGVLFVSAGTCSYWQAWVYGAVLVVPMSLLLVYLIIKDPALLARRMQFKEREAEQKRIIKLSSVIYILIYLLPGLDSRFAWSQVPWVWTLVADLFVLLGYLSFVWVMKVNSYAARTVEVVPGQEVISSGPYAWVRHPMYAGNILMLLATPVALGSWWALLPAVLVIPILVMRIRNEEAVLIRDLPGYAEYHQLVRYRLFPGIW